MNISYRLKEIANSVSKCELLADIGTDHCYIPIYLFNKGIIKKAIASDISAGSVEKAKNNVKKYNLENFIDTRCGYGLSTIKENEIVNTIIISGMGGLLINEILNNSKNILKNLNQLILQPQKDIDKVRRNLHKLNFKIINEIMICENNKYYNILVSEKGNDVYYNDKEYFLGKLLIDNKNCILKEYINIEMYKLKIILESINIENKKINKLNQIQNIYEEVLKCL